MNHNKAVHKRKSKSDKGNDADNEDVAAPAEDAIADADAADAASHAETDTEDDDGSQSSAELSVRDQAAS